MLVLASSPKLGVQRFVASFYGYRTAIVLARPQSLKPPTPTAALMLAMKKRPSLRPLTGASASENDRILITFFCHFMRRLCAIHG
jgi:hypothetical protein